ncbi:MAG: hypothetical protein H5T85_03695 [Actinobacteria bacterium]|nr:hypothetical protein [Actinomycetota bacterium]
MISANEFILFYNELFKYLNDSFGKHEVEKLWAEIKDTYCKKLEDLIAEKGLQGMYEYWSKNLIEEGGKHNITLTNTEFIIDMHYCPSMGKLLNTHVLPYDDYCGHCPALFREIVEKQGFEFDYYIINRTKGECRLHVRKRELQQESGPKFKIVQSM